MEPETYKQKLEDWLKNSTTYGNSNVYHDHLYEELQEAQQKALSNAMTNTIDKVGNPYPTHEEKKVQPDSVFFQTEQNKIAHLRTMAKKHFDGFFNNNPSQLMKEFCVVAGGCFVSWHHYTSPKDIDVFVLYNSLAQQILDDYLDKQGFTMKNSEYLKQSNKGAKHVQKIWEGNHLGVQFQFIFTDCSTREELLADFDFKHCMTSYHNDKLYITRNIYNAIRDRVLIVNNAENIMPWRIEKFKEKHFTFPAENGETLGDILARALDNVRKKSTIDLSHIRTNGPKMVNWRALKSRPSQQDDTFDWLKIT